MVGVALDMCRGFIISLVIIPCSPALPFLVAPFPFVSPASALLVL